MVGEKIRTICTSCQAKMRVPEKALGKKVRCPKCGESFRVAALPARPEPKPVAEPLGLPPEPASDDSFGGDDDLFDGLSGGASLETQEDRLVRLEEQAAAAASAEIVVKDESRPNAATAAPTAKMDMVPWLTNCGTVLLSSDIKSRILLAMVIFGGVFAWLGVKENTLRSESSAVPQDIACATLAQSGPGGNRHVVLNDFFLLPEFVYEEGFGSDNWPSAYVPAIPITQWYKEVAAVLEIPVSEVPTLSNERYEVAMDAMNLKAMSFGVLVKFTDTNPTEIAELEESQQLQGMVMTDYTALESEERDILESSYSTASLNNASILVVGREPGSAGMAFGMIFGGIALTGLGLFLTGREAASMVV